MSISPAPLKVTCSCGAVLSYTSRPGRTTIKCPNCRQPVPLPAAPANIPGRWHLGRGKEKLGPFSFAELRQMAATGQLQPSDMLLAEDSPRWAPASSVSGLFSPPPSAPSHASPMPFPPLPPVSTPPNSVGAARAWTSARFWLRWPVLAGAGGALVLIVVLIIVFSRGGSSGDPVAKGPEGKEVEEAKTGHDTKKPDDRKKPDDAKKSGDPVKPPPVDDEGTVLAEIAKAGGMVVRDEKDPRKPVIAVNFDFEGRVTEKTFALLAKLPRLQRFEMFQNRLFDPKAALAHFAGHEGLRDFVLFNVPIWDHNVAQIAKIPNLEDLSGVSMESVTSKGLLPLAALKKLRVLNLSRCIDLGDKTLANLAGIENLEVLTLSNNNFIGQGLAHLKDVPKLRILKLSEVFALNESIAGPHLATLSTLQELDLHRSPFSDASLPHFAKMKSLRVLDLTKTRFTAKGIAELSKALPDCNVFGP